MNLTLCGSAKFEKEFHEWNEKLTLAGHVVYSLAVFPSTKGNVHEWYDELIKKKLDFAHFAKIDNSDAIVVLDVNFYVGKSTQNEIMWARLKGKKVYFMSSTAKELLCVK